MSDMTYISVNKETKRVERIDNVLMEDFNYEVIPIEKDISECFDYINCKYVNGNFIKNEEKDEEIKKASLRELRKPLLDAFDIYKSNISYGIIQESDSTHDKISKWYINILDLDEEAIDNPPEEIEKYL